MGESKRSMSVQGPVVSAFHHAAPLKIKTGRPGERTACPYSSTLGSGLLAVSCSFREESLSAAPDLFRCNVFDMRREPPLMTKRI